MTKWNCLDDLFQALNKECNYLILRNYEGFSTDEVFLKDHEDIDFLCDNAAKLAEVLGAVPRKQHLNRTVQLWIDYKDTQMKIDVREIGDGYYDRAWQQVMLDRRVLHPLGFYVMCEEDYFYSLAYHAVLQKKKLSEEYLSRLSSEGKNYGFSISSETDLLNILIDYVKKNGYHFTYCKDFTVPNRFELVPAELCKGKTMWRIRRKKYYTMKKICGFQN